MKFAIKDAPAYRMWTHSDSGESMYMAGNAALASVIATVARESGRKPAEFRLGYGVYDTMMVLEAIEKHLTHLEENPESYDQGSPRSLARAKKRALWARDVVKAISK